MEVLRHICGEIIHLDPQGAYHERFDREGAGQPITACPLCGDVLEEGWFRPLYRVENMDRAMMERTIRAMACSNCWKHDLIVQEVQEIDPETEEPIQAYRVLCAECLEETQGYVSSRYIGRARERDYQTYLINRIGLEQAMGLQPERKVSIEQSLRELGFGL